MRTMCRVLPVLVLASVALGQDRFPAVLKALNLAREKPFSPGARARVAPAVEEIVGLKDARAIQPLAAFVVQTLVAEDRLFREMIETQKRGAKARRRSDEIETQLKHLDVRLRAGATDVAPQIDALKRERVVMDNAFQGVTHEIDAQQRAVNYARDLRDDLVTGCVTILRAIKSEQVPTALIALSRGFDIAKEHETLLLIPRQEFHHAGKYGLRDGRDGHVEDTGHGRRQSVSAEEFKRKQAGKNDFVSLREEQAQK